MYLEEANFLTQASSVRHMAMRDVELELTLTLLSRHLTHAEVICFLREEDSSDTDMLRGKQSLRRRGQAIIYGIHEWDACDRV